MIRWKLDSLLFGLLAIGAIAAVHLWVRRWHGAGLRRGVWIALVLLVVAGLVMGEMAERSQRQRLREMLAGFTPTYAQELQRMGHARLSIDVTSNDPLYRSILDAERRWQEANPIVTGIYTLRKTPDGQILFLTDSQSASQMTAAARLPRDDRLWDTPRQQLDLAFAGQGVYRTMPVTDRHGTWVSSFVPLRDEHGNVEAVLDVDYDAAEWLSDMAWDRAATLGLMGVLVAMLISTASAVTVMRVELQHRRAAELAVRESESRLRAILDNEPEAVIVTEPGGAIVQINPSALAMLGPGPTPAILGHPIQQSIHSDDRTPFLAALAAAGRGQVHNLKFRLSRLDGGASWLEGAAVPLQRNGKVANILIVARDITAKHIAEAERELLQRQLLDASRRAGMAEVATGVLHNVGNVLNSVKVSSSLLTEKLRGSRVTNLARAAEMLSEHQADLPDFVATDERGRQLPKYLVMLAQFLTEENATLLTETRNLERGVEHISQIVRLQQSYAKTKPLLETLRPSELMEEALHVNAAAFEKHNIQIDRHYDDIEPLPLDRHNVLQILVNLIANAKEATKGAASPTKRITLSITRLAGQHPPHIRFQVSDTGIGIDPQSLTRIFTFGFTTRDEGHGFGLHSAANAARQMGGSLAAASDGPGRGATFTLDLPCAAEVAA